MALDTDGRPSFNMLQNYGSATAPLHFFVFDLLVLNGRDVTLDLLVKRRELLEKRVLKAWVESSGRDPREAALKSKTEVSTQSRVGLAYKNELILLTNHGRKSVDRSGLVSQA